MELLKDKGITQQEFANMAGVSLNTAQRWVHGKQMPQFAPWDFFRLAKRMGVSPYQLAQMMREAYEKGQRTLKAAETSEGAYQTEETIALPSEKRSDNHS